jgi:hypothetical protein
VLRGISCVQTDVSSGCVQIWPRVHNQVMFCLVLAQLVLVFILAIKKVRSSYALYHISAVV